MDAALPPGGELSAAAEALERWLRRDKHAGDPQRRARAAADFLLRRGFSPPIVWDLVRNHLRVEDEPPADA
jgi:SOS response regulatory protein OraA/RecX